MVLTQNRNLNEHIADKEQDGVLASFISMSPKCFTEMEPKFSVPTQEHTHWNGIRIQLDNNLLQGYAILWNDGTITFVGVGTEGNYLDGNYRNVDKKCR